MIKPRRSHNKLEPALALIFSLILSYHFYLGSMKKIPNIAKIMKIAISGA